MQFQDMKKRTVWDVPAQARKFHYWRGFTVGAVVGGLIVFAVGANLIIKMLG